MYTPSSNIAGGLVFEIELFEALRLRQGASAIQLFMALADLEEKDESFFQSKRNNRLNQVDLPTRSDLAIKTINNHDSSIADFKLQ